MAARIAGRSMVRVGCRQSSLKIFDVQEQLIRLDHFQPLF
jgi:hypothetical protein